MVSSVSGNKRQQRPPNQRPSWPLLVTTVDPSTDEHPDHQQSIRGEVESWVCEPPTRRCGTFVKPISDARRVTRPVIPCYRGWSVSVRADA